VLRRKIAGNIYFLIPFNRKKFSSTGIVISAAKIASDLEIDLGYEMGTIRAMHLKRYGKDLYKEEDLNQMLYAIKEISCRLPILQALTACERYAPFSWNR